RVRHHVFGNGVERHGYRFVRRVRVRPIVGKHAVRGAAEHDGAHRFEHAQLIAVRLVDAGDLAFEEADAAVQLSGIAVGADDLFDDKLAHGASVRWIHRNDERKWPKSTFEAGEQCQRRFWTSLDKWRNKGQSTYLNW